MTVSTRSSARGVLRYFALSGLMVGLAGHPSAQLVSRPHEGYIAGVVVSSQGPEVGVWVIAETNELRTKFAKIVVTNDAGRFVLPELPNALYNVWVRGYGLVDSTPIKAKPSSTALTLKAMLAQTPQEAAKVYPADYWFSMLEPPAKSEFPGTGTGPQGNGISVNMKSQAQWIDNMKQGCGVCHQVGNQLTRDLTHLKALGFKSSEEAWDYRVQTGQRGNQMTASFSRFGRPRALKMYADWTDRIASGEVPALPPRPRGVERNLVVTMWDWGNDNSFIHDTISTAKSNPLVNPDGPVYAVSAGHGTVVAVDPVENTATETTIPTRDDATTMPTRFPQGMVKPSNFVGNTPQWGTGTDKADPHNPMMDRKGRLWLTSTVRGRENPAFCKAGSSNPYAENFPLTTSGRQVSFYDPATGKFTLIDTCFNTHHLQFNDDDSMLYFSGGSAVMPWINVKMFEQTGDEKASQGWCPTVLDTNGDGKITKPWNEPLGGGKDTEEGGGGGRMGKLDPKLDTRVLFGSYGVIASPVDGSAWAASTDFPGHLYRFTPGSNPPASCMTELYTLPDGAGFGPRGIDVDRNGVIWTALSGSSHLASFDRRKCTVFNGPGAVDGLQCPQGWALYQTEGPNLKGTDVRADYHYYNWVDQFNTLGLGENIPIVNGSQSDSLLALMPATKQWVTLRVPYPLGFFSRGLDGRIDDPKAGWKGRGLWANYGNMYIWHTEGGKGTKSKSVHFQLRPDPLAR
jgi:hypothetical protein